MAKINFFIFYFLFFEERKMLYSNDLLVVDRVVLFLTVCALCSRPASIEQAADGAMLKERETTSPPCGAGGGAGGGDPPVTGGTAAGAGTADAGSELRVGPGAAAGNGNHGHGGHGGHGGAALCSGCGGRIADRYYLLAVDRQWHSSCLRCSECSVTLATEQTCFSRGGHIFCKEDYYRYIAGMQGPGFDPTLWHPPFRNPRS